MGRGGGEGGWGVGFFFFKQKTAYEIVSRDWSSDVCSSDLGPLILVAAALLNGLPDLCLYLHLKVWGFVYRDVHCRTRPDW